MITKKFINKKIQKKYMSYYTSSITQQKMRIDIYKKSKYKGNKIEKRKKWMKNWKHK